MKNERKRQQGGSQNEENVSWSKYEKLLIKVKKKSFKTLAN